MVIDDATTNVANDNSGEGTSSKEAIVEIEAQGVEVEEHSSERESTPMKSRMETRSLSRSPRPLTPPKVHPSISRNDKVSTSKKPSSGVVKNHPESNIIDSLDEGLCLRKRSTLVVNHVTYHCYLVNLSQKR